MKKLIAILLASSFAIVAVANAAHEDPKAKKAAAKVGPVQQQNVAPKQHIVTPKQNFTPRSSHVEKVHRQKNVNLIGPKVNQTSVSGPKFKSKTATVPGSKNVPSIQSQTNARNPKSINKQQVMPSNDLPAVQNNQTNIVAPNTKPIPKKYKSRLRP